MAKLKVKWTAKAEGPKGRRMPTQGDLNKYLRPVLIKTRDKAWKHYKNIMSPWSVSNRAKLVRKTGKGTIGGSMSMFSTVGTEQWRTPLVWLEDGTQVRYVGMTSDWESKTYPGIGIQPQRPGKGYALKGLWGDYPGIKPRHFREGIIKDIEPAFHSEMKIAWAKMGKDLLWD